MKKDSPLKIFVIWGLSPEEIQSFREEGPREKYGKKTEKDGKKEKEKTKKKKLIKIN